MRVEQFGIVAFRWAMQPTSDRFRFSEMVAG
jgi:hypothetical protein